MLSISDKIEIGDAIQGMPFTRLGVEKIKRVEEIKSYKIGDDLWDRYFLNKVLLLNEEI